MRFGCFGCLILIVAILVVVVAAAGFIFLSGNMGTPPEDVQPTRFTREDGFSAQRKLYEVVLRESGRSTRTDPVILSEGEVNAFLANHLAEAADLPFSPLIVRFAGGQLELRGQTVLRNLLQGPPFPHLMPYLPAASLNQTVWVTVRGRFVIDHPRTKGGRSYARVEVTEFALGKQPVGRWLLWIMLGSTSSKLLRFQVPSIVDSVQIDERRAVIRTQ
jgi:hypothetical protein